MQNLLLELINEQTSPLFRIIWISNLGQANMQLSNNISACHVGNGHLLSVAHNLRTSPETILSIDNSIYNSHFQQSQPDPLDQFYILDPLTNKRILTLPTDDTNKAIAQAQLGALLRRCDTRWFACGQLGIFKPYLLVSFNDPVLYGNQSLATQLDNAYYFNDAGIGKHTYALELELKKAWYKEDIALYKVVDTSQRIIPFLPSIGIDFSFLSEDQDNLYLLQSSPNSEVGHLISKSHIDGYLDNVSVGPDALQVNYPMSGLRYFIKTYFRFGSSGAPYIYYNKEDKKFKINAIQSEAAPLQLQINNNLNGNFQYMNAIASPLNIIKDELETYL